MSDRALIGQKTEPHRSEHTIVFQIVQENNGHFTELIRVIGLNPSQFREAVRAKRDQLRQYPICPETVHIGERMSHTERKIVKSAFAKDVDPRVYCGILYEELEEVVHQAS